jgi:hypothetical protein
MPDEAALREFARLAIRQGRLPRRAPDRAWGGSGCGSLCAVCENPITSDQTEYEISFGEGDLDMLHLHIRCFAVWELERTKPVS